MEMDKKYALLDTDFLYKSHLARNSKKCKKSYADRLCNGICGV